MAYGSSNNIYVLNKSPGNLYFFKFAVSGSAWSPTWAYSYSQSSIPLGIKFSEGESITYSFVSDGIANVVIVRSDVNANPVFTLTLGVACCDSFAMDVAP